MYPLNFVSLFILTIAGFSSAIPIQDGGLTVTDQTCDAFYSTPSHVAACITSDAQEPQILNENTVERSDLEKRGTNFISPHRQRAFVIGLASQIITGATWVFDIWVNDGTSTTQVWRSDVSTSTNLHEGNVLIPALRTIYGSTSQYRGAATFQATGYVGTAELIVTFTAEIFASAAETIIQSMITAPAATLAGAAVDVTSWSFDAEG